MPSNQKFGLLFSAIFFGSSIYFQWKNYSWLVICLLFLAILFLLFTICAPIILAPLNRAWFALSLFLGKLISPMALSIIFFVLIVPVALVTRLFGRDELLLKKRQSMSYWINKPPIKPDSFKNQF
ncbi:hypothetical protein AOC21_01695 [Polynucleobacter sp. VK25]|uniref:SxtJ family membrane protein n=1 Tax=Polynucleobacter sp. VK25 TaxID=1758398 RepID=UPI001BFE9708|nr:SxtJ family membrane protein [Polynucleobacter sp. VK25]QWD68651.1 hypothetical protein AOC21_01695 [Polynucleobacter sp. VK25]